jgi:hypothetical protein
MNILFKLIGLSLTFCLWGKFTLQAAHLAALTVPRVWENDDSAQQRCAVAPMAPSIDSWSQIPQHLHHARLSLEGIALFNGHSYVSYTIKASPLSNWSHTGLWIRDTRYNLDDRNGWYVFESLVDPSRTGFAASSAAEAYNVRLASWNHDVRSSDDISLRHFHYERGKKPRSRALKLVVKKYIGRPYEQNLLELADGLLGANTRENAHSIFCSELNALVLQDLGLLSRADVASNFMPAHFSVERKSSALPLIDAHLGREHIMQQAPRSVFRTVFESVTDLLRFFASGLGLI